MTADDALHPERPDLSYSVVIPTIGRRCLADCLQALAAASGPGPYEVFLVDDRPAADGPLDTRGAGPLTDRLRLLTTGGRGPAAARNAGLREVTTPWVVFLDDDVRVEADWGSRLADDLTAADPMTVGVQGRLTVPLPADREPTDWERCTAGLQEAAWATADMAYRTQALMTAGGFDERFRRAFREDADLALRMMDAGWKLARGGRSTLHPVRPADRMVSVRAQRGNADDALMHHLHGAGWWTRAAAPRGRLPRHLAVTAAALAAAALALAGRRRGAAVAAGLWALGTAEFAWARIAPGPRTAPEVATMIGTSVVIPPLAVRHWAVGRVRHRGATPWGDRA
ncbi:glycosyltransferase [Streptomyces sp. NPDC001743]|uniref:glycosyltransferase family 2 protein n=1 Tax=Streptomyces sp. NPDC001743 TaxID=3154397 RepID=UPI0033297540